MRKKRIQQTLQALREEFQRAGMPLDELTLKFARKIARDTRFRQLHDARLGQIAAASALAAVLLTVEKCDLPAKQFDQFLEKITQELVYGLRPGMQTLMKEAAMDFPKRRPGPKDTLSPEQQADACDLVSQYSRDGDSKRTAYEKVARKMNCTPRKIQRAWKLRGTLPSTARS